MKDERLVSPLSLIRIPSYLIPMRDLLTDPLWRPGDLGRPIPDSPHAVSVCLPRWADNTGYEEGEPRVIERMQSGYPRFFYHPLCRELFAECRRRVARADEDCLALASKNSAVQLQRFLKREAGADCRVEPFGRHGVHAAVFPGTAAATAKLGWQHLGGGVSSRLAEACLQERDARDAASAKQTLKDRVAQLAGVDVDDVWLFPCGMNAVDSVHRALQKVHPGRKSVQFGFPYVDTLKVLQKTGPGAHFLPRGDEADLQTLSELLQDEPVAGVYTEFPSNPLLECPDLERLRDLSRRSGCPLIADDTISGFHNVELSPVADVVTSSLTKSFSGIGDVTGGSVILNRESGHFSELKTALESVYEDTLFADDAIVLERNSRDYAGRMPRINETARRVAEFFSGRPEVESVFYPPFGNVAAYDRFRRPHGGYGCLLSIVLKEPADTTARFFDRLRINKGPNLGTNYTLACPFTILAHYNELDFAESCGVSRWLIRISVGLEPAEELIDRFAEAL